MLPLAEKILEALDACPVNPLLVTLNPADARILADDIRVFDAIDARYRSWLLNIADGGIAPDDRMMAMAIFDVDVAFDASVPVGAPRVDG